VIRKWKAKDKSTDHVEQIHPAIAVVSDYSQRIRSSLAGSLGLDEAVKMIEDYGRNRDESETVDFRYELSRGRYSTKLDQAAV